MSGELGTAPDAQRFTSPGTSSITNPVFTAKQDGPESRLEKEKRRQVEGKGTPSGASRNSGTVHQAARRASRSVDVEVEGVRERREQALDHSVLGVPHARVHARARVRVRGTALALLRLAHGRPACTLRSQTLRRDYNGVLLQDFDKHWLLHRSVRWKKHQQGLTRG